MAEALVGGIQPHPLDLTSEPFRLQLKGSLELLGLEATGRLVPVRGVGAFDRVADQRDELRPRQVGGNTFRCERVEHVVAAGLTGDRWTVGTRGARTRVGPEREVRAVPLRSARVVEIEVVDALVQPV